MAGSKVLSRIAQGTSQIVGTASMWPPFFAVLAMVTMVSISIASRYLGRPLHFVEEYTGYLAAVITMVTLAYILKRSKHISIDFVPELLPRRGRIGLETVTMLVSLGVVVLLFIAGTNLVIDSFAVNRTAWTIAETPMGWVQLIVPVVLGLLIIQRLFELVNKIKSLFMHQ